MAEATSIGAPVIGAQSKRISIAMGSGRAEFGGVAVAAIDHMS